MEMIQQEEEAFELQEESADKDVVMEELVNTVDPSSTQSNQKM